MKKDFSGKKLLVLAGADVHRKLVSAAKGMGVYVIVTDNLDPSVSPAKKIADEYWNIDITDVDSIVKKCMEAHVDGVLTYSIDPAQLPYCKICSRLNLPCYGTLEQFEIMTNKRLFKDFCIKNGVEVVPEYTMEDVNNDRVEYPVLVKPLESRGSRGQSVCNIRDEVRTAVDIARRECSRNGYIIERYLGDEYQDMALAYVVVDCIPYLVKCGDRNLGRKEDNLDRQQMVAVLPSRYASEYVEKCSPLVEAMISNLGIKFGAVFLQGFYKGGHIYMYDPGLRLPGSDFDLVLRKSTGLDLPSTFVHYALTGDTKYAFGPLKNAYQMGGAICLIFAVAVRPGVVSEVLGIEAFSKDERILSIDQRIYPEDTIPSTGDIRQRAIELIVYLPDRESIPEFAKYVYDTYHVIDIEGKDMICSRVDF